MKTQTITRTDLKKLNAIACNNWKAIIADIALEEGGTKIEVKNELISRAYSEANVDQKKEIKKYFDIISDKFQDRIKTFEDALNHTCVNMADLGLWAKPKTKRQKASNAFTKLGVISEALNDGWKPDFNNRNQPKYYCWFEKRSGVWVFSNSDYGYHGANFGSGFYLETREKAEYFGKQFLQLFIDYLPE